MAGHVKTPQTSDPDYRGKSALVSKSGSSLTGAAVPKPICLADMRLWGRMLLTQQDMARLARVSRSTIQAALRNQEYRTAYELGRVELEVKLKRMQYAKAMEGDTAMLIHLGKVVLGQSIKPSKTSRS